MMDDFKNFELSEQETDAVSGGTGRRKEVHDMILTCGGCGKPSRFASDVDLGKKIMCPKCGTLNSFSFSNSGKDGEKLDSWVNALANGVHRLL